MARPFDVIEHPVTGERITFLQTAAQTGGALLQGELAVAPGGFVPLAHIHPIQEERFAVRSGTMLLEVDGVERLLAPGDVATVPAGTPHAWRNDGAGELVVIVEFRPALNAEECFESGFGLAQDGLVDPATGLPVQPWLALIFDAYHDFVRPVDVPIDALLQQLQPVVAEAHRRGLRMPYPYPYVRANEPAVAGRSVG